jgi:hypothetical protein
LSAFFEPSTKGVGAGGADFGGGVSFFFKIGNPAFVCVGLSSVLSASIGNPAFVFDIDCPDNGIFIIILSLLF